MKFLINSFVSSLRTPFTRFTEKRRFSNVFDQSFSSVALAADFASPWSVNGDTLNSTDLAASLFGVSLLPYLALLYFLSREKTNTPKLGNFGFQFLLVFVFATIPAGIYAKVQYHDILANVDWLHGIAESLLTVTNLLIVYGFRKPRQQISDNSPKSSDVIVAELGVPILLLLLSLSSSYASIFPHTEPSNALSIPTWMVHTSSLQEWLIAMKLIWNHSEVSNNPRWKGMAWGMLPSHTSGVCACTYHLFYNSPAFNWIVALQALLTVLGNTTMAFAAYRVFQFENQKTCDGSVSDAGLVTPTQTPRLEESDWDLAKKLLVTSFLSAVAVKYGELFFGFPFQSEWYFPLSIILFSTSFHGSLYAWKSFREDQLKSSTALEKGDF